MEPYIFYIVYHREIIHKCIFKLSLRNQTVYQLY